MPTLYAPACMPRFTGNNGGATYRQGVTGKQITIVAYQLQLDATQAAAVASSGANSDPEAAQQTVRDYIEYFEHDYQTYGRSVKVIFFEASGNQTDTQAAKADAIKVATEYKAFASLGGPGGNTAYAEELAARGVLCIFCKSSVSSDDFFHRLAPYAWSPVFMSLTQLFTMYAEYIGKRLIGRKARWAGDASYQARARRVGVVYPDMPDDRTAVNHFEAELARYGGRLAAKVAFPGELNRTAEQARTVIAKLKDEEVTTVLIEGFFHLAIFTKEATRQQYFPEWIPATPAAQSSFIGRTADQTQWAHAFAPANLPVGLPYELGEPYRVFSWHHHRAPSDRIAAALSYPLLRLLFTGIHMAGPTLTPQTFRAGMFAFPPSGGGPTNPYMSFGRHGLWSADDYAAIDDQTEIWWDAQAPGNDELGNPGFGLFRYVDGGRRYFADKWPRTEPRLFDPRARLRNTHRSRPETNRRNTRIETASNRNVWTRTAGVRTWFTYHLTSW